MDRENLQLRRLGENDHVTAFDCGDEDIDEPTRLLYFDLNDLDED